MLNERGPSLPKSLIILRREGPTPLDPLHDTPDPNVCITVKKLSGTQILKSSLIYCISFKKCYPLENATLLAKHMLRHNAL